MSEFQSGFVNGGMCVVYEFDSWRVIVVHEYFVEVLVACINQHVAVVYG